MSVSTSEFLNVNNLSFRYDKKMILNDLSFQLRSGKIASLLGPSGCGKTTLLRLIAGFHNPVQGSVMLNGKTVSSPQYVLAPEKRELGMVFQDYALFPHLSVAQNITFGVKNSNKAKSQQKIGMLLEMVGLSGYEKKMPHELSGGEQQRISIARAVAPSPKLLLMDEPFASLDTNLRERLAHDLGDLLKTLDISAILVTHDQREAFAVSEYIGLIREGSIEQWDHPYNIYHEPKTPFVANFVGQGIMVKATIATNESVDCEFGRIQADRAFIEPIGTELCMLLRPDDIVLDKHSPLKATIERKFFRGANTLYEISYKGIKFVANFTSHANFPVGAEIKFAIQADHLVTFNHDTHECLC